MRFVKFHFYIFHFFAFVCRLFQLPCLPCLKKSLELKWTGRFYKGNLKIIALEHLNKTTTTNISTSSMWVVRGGFAVRIASQKSLLSDAACFQSILFLIFIVVMKLNLKKVYSIFFFVLNYAK